MQNKDYTAEAQMLIRAEAKKVFNAFINPEITKHFWFTHGSGKLEVNKEIVWTWEMYNVSARVVTTEIIANKLIHFNWFGGGITTTVTINFKEMDDSATYVTIVHSGFDLIGDELITALKDSTGGFTMVLAGLKAYLEHGINLNLVADKVV